MLRILALLVLSLVAIPSARAASCAVTVGSLNFGAVDSLYSAPVDTASTVQVDCDQVSVSAFFVTVCIHLGSGTGGSGGGVRHMTATAGRTLDFQLYQDSGRSIAWGASGAPGLGAARSVRLAVAGETASATLTLYGRVLGGQTGAASGNYASSFAGGDAAYSYAEGELNCDTPGAAGTGQSSFGVEASVPANCLVEATDIAFGDHGIIDHDIDAEGAVGITCTPGTEFSVTLGGGLRNSANPEQRILQSGSDQAVYGLYRDSRRTEPWGSSIETQLPGTGAGTRQSVIVYGRVPAQPVKPGVYTDTVAVTITYDDLP